MKPVIPYKEYFAKHFGTVNNAGELWVGDFHGNTLEELETYLKHLRKWVKHLTIATELREEFTRVSIGVDNEDPPHKYWREAMRCATDYAQALLTAWTSTRDQWLDDAIAMHPPTLAELPDVDQWVRNPDPPTGTTHKRKLVKLRPSKQELARRVALMRKAQEQRDARDHATLDKQVAIVHKDNLAAEIKMCGLYDYTYEQIIQHITNMYNGTIHPDIEVIMYQLVRIIYRTQEPVAAWFLPLYVTYVKTHADEPSDERGRFASPCKEIMGISHSIATSLYNCSTGFAQAVVDDLGQYFKDTQMFHVALSDALAFMDLQSIQAPTDIKNAIMVNYVTSWYYMAINCMETKMQNPDTQAHIMASHRFLGEDPRDLRPVAKIIGCTHVVVPRKVRESWRNTRRRYLAFMKRNAK